jgi:hypothetical protein
MSLILENFIEAKNVSTFKMPPVMHVEYIDDSNAKG